MSNVAIFHFPPRETLSHDPLARIRVTTQGIAPLITMIARSVEFHKSTYQCQEPILADVSANVFGKSLMYARNKVSHPTLMEGIHRATDDAIRISITTSSTAAATASGGGASSARALGGGSRANLSGGGSQAAMAASGQLRYRSEEEHVGNYYGSNKGGHTVSAIAGGGSNAAAASVSASLVMKPPPSLFGGNATTRSGGVGVAGVGDYHSVGSGGGGGAYPLNASSCSSGGTASTYDRYRSSLSVTPPQATTGGGGGKGGGSSPTSSSSASSQANFTHPATSRRGATAAGINTTTSSSTASGGGGTSAQGNERGGGGGSLYSHNNNSYSSEQTAAAAAVVAAASSANRVPRKHLGVFGRAFVVVVTVGRIETSTIASFFKSSIGSKRVPCELWRFYCLKTPHEVIQMENTLAGLSLPTTMGGGIGLTDPFSTSVTSASSSSLFLNNSGRYGGVTAGQSEEAAAGGYAFGSNRNEGVGIAPAFTGAAVGAGAYAVSAPHSLLAPPCTVGGVQLHPEGPKTINLMSNDPRQCKECIRFISDVCYEVGGVTKPTVDSETMYSVAKGAEGVYFDVHVERET